MKKRLLAMIMTLAMCLSLLPTAAFATVTTETGDAATPDQVVSDGSEQTVGEGKVKHSKMITQTGENSFNITLTVQTKEEVQEQVVSPDAAVVLVLDVSNSMKAEDISSAKEAAKGFVNTFVGDVGEASRQVAVVEFGSNAKTVLNWTEANTESGLNAINAGIDTIANRFAYTAPQCTEAGEHVHYELESRNDATLIEYKDPFGMNNAGWYCTICDERVSKNGSNNEPSDVTHMCLVEVNDSSRIEYEEHYYSPDGWYCNVCEKLVSEEDENSSSVNATHHCFKVVTYSGPHGEQNANDGGGTNIEAGLLLAKNLLSGNAIAGIENLFVVMMTDGVPTFHVVDANESTATDIIVGTYGGGDSATHDDYHDVYCTQSWNGHTSGDNLPGAIKDLGAKLYTVSYKSDDIDKTVNNQDIDTWLANFSTQAFKAGDDIETGLENIAQLIVNQAQAWILTDPMGDYIDFVSGDSVASVTNATADTSSAVRKYNADTKTLIWDLKSDATRSEKDGNGWYTYTMTYAIKLDTLADGYAANTDYQTNGTTVLTYMLTEDGQVQNQLYETNLIVPVVKGYAGDLSFNKVGSGVSLPGAKFKLTCGDWESEEVASGENGVVEFNNIPSGHTYSLIETEAPAGYAKVEPIDVTVAYGTVTADITDGKVVDPESASLTIAKEYGQENEYTDNDSTYTVEIAGDAGSDYSRVTGARFDNTGKATVEVTADEKAVEVKGLPFGEYTITEIDAEKDGYTLNTTYSKESVTLNAGESVTLDADNPSDSITVTNTYTKLPTTGTLIVTKTVNGLDTLPANFAISVTKGDTEVQSLIVSEATKAENVYTWTLTGVAPGTYSVTESNYVVNGYSVKVTENPSEVEVAAGKTETLALTNTYTAAPATLSSDKLQVSKVLSGREWTQGDSFNFTLTGSAGAPMPANSSVTISGTDESKTKSFGAITFTEVGTYTYTVKETKGNLSGVNYDNSVYTVTVVVSAEANGALTAAATYQKGNEQADRMIFTNTYGASSVTVPSSDLQVSKVLSGREWTQGDSFTFTLTGSQGAPMPENTSVNITNANEKKSFGAITFTEAGTYTYTVTENTGTLGGVSYDSSEYVITVTVTDNNQGQLLKSVSYAKKASANAQTESITYDSTKGMVFENTYSAQEATITGSTALKVSKDIDGREWNDSDSYTFTLAAGANTAGEGVATPMPAAGDETVTLTKSNQNGAFGNITFNKAGVYNYTVTENDDTTIAGVTKDDTTYHVTVTVTDNKAGQLEAAVTYMAGETDYNDLYITNNGMKFTNTYSASGTLDGDTQLMVSKTLNGRDWAEGETFTIKLTGSADAPMPAEGGDTVTLTKTNATGAFGDIAYDEDDIGKTYTYTVKEIVGSASGVTYDSTQYTVTVNVAVNANDASMLDVTAVHTSSADAEKETPAYNYATVGNMPFTNTYKAGSVIVPGDDGEGVEGKLEISKSFSGRDWAEGDVFTFNIAAVTEGAPMPASTSVTIGKPASGTENTGAFGNITFDEVGEYKYTVSETKGTLSNVTYDTVAYTVTINVTDDGTGALKYSVAYSSSKGEFDYTAKDGMAFVNTYSKPSGGGGIHIPDKPPVLNKVDHFAYVVGYPDGNVKPNGNITRAEVATIFFRMLTDESRDEFWSQSSDYSDVTATKWFNNAVCTLSNGGIITGYADGTFKPNGNITRAEFATMAVRFFSASYEGESLFPDIDQHWAKDYINTAAYEGLINGYEDGTFRPNQPITRAEAMAIVNRVLDRHPDKDNLLEDMIQWPDNMDTEKWYYADVQEATNSHDYDMEGTEAEPYEVWTEILPVRDWVAFEKEWSDSNSAEGGEVMK